MTATNNLPKSPLCDSVVGNYQGNTVRILLAHLAELLGDGGSGSGSSLAAEIEARIAGDRNTGILQLQNIGGTGDAITADLVSDGGIADLGPASRLLYTPTQTNTAAEPTLTVAGTTLRVRCSDDTVWPAGAFAPGRAYWLQKFGGFARVMTEVSLTDLLNHVAVETNARVAAIAAEAAARATAITAEATARQQADLLETTARQDADFALTVYSQPGEGIVYARDADGNTVMRLRDDGVFEANLRARDLIDYVDLPTLPGEYIGVTLYDANGEVVAGIDMRTGLPVHAGLEDEPGDGGSGDGDGTVTNLLSEEANAIGDATNVRRGPDGQVYYDSANQWGPTMIGYERRGDVHLAETKSVAVGTVAFGGGGIGVIRPVDEAYPYHLIGPNLTPAPLTAAGASGVATLDRRSAARQDRPTTLAISRPVSSTVTADALVGSVPRTELAAAVTQAVDNLALWGKTLFVDRILLSLLEGQPTTPQNTAEMHYGAIAASLRSEIANITGQADPPWVVINQSAGTRSDGTSPVILAEDTIYRSYYSILIVGTPKYPFPMADGMAGTHTPEAYSQISQIEDEAIAVVQAGGEWHPPSLNEITATGSTVKAQFWTISPLVLRDPDNHGFDVLVDGALAEIASVTVAGSEATITLTSAMPAGAAVEGRYSWGRTGDQGDGYAANRGSLTDSWSTPWRLDPSVTLYRYALSGRAFTTAS